MNKIDLAPIVLFVYNRPEHTRQTLTALSQNVLADQSVLYIYADGAKLDATQAQLEQIRLTRDVLKEAQWCKEVHIIESETNKGLADSIIQGVTEIVNKYGKIIVLEDDIVTSPYFLQYMNDALHVYKDENKVMHISGYLPKSDKKIILPHTFFLRFMSCWGWGTWADRWQLLIEDISYLHQRLPLRSDFEEFNYAGLDETDMFRQIEDNFQGKIKTWAIKWYATIFMKQGLCLYPQASVVVNIGFDGSGTHSGSVRDLYQVSIFQEPINVVLLDTIEESSLGKIYLNQAFLRIQNIRDKNYYFVDRLRNKYPSLVNYVFRIFNFLVRKYK